MIRTLRHLLVGTGVVCLLLGLGQVILGAQLMPGATVASATAESSERFAGGLLTGFGVAWLWTARRLPLPVHVARFLAGVLLLGAVGRLVALAVAGWPQWLQLGQLGVEVVVPIAVLVLSAIVAKHRHRDPEWPKGDTPTATG